MVGGFIVAIVEEEDRLCVTVADRRYGRHEFCCVDMARTAHPVAVGDSLWWQGRECLWTPRGENPAWDVHIPRFGYSYHAPHPSPRGCAADLPSADVGPFRGERSC